MTTATQNAPKLANLRVRELKPLSSPSRLKKEIPVSSTAETTVRKGREEVEAVLEGKDSRPLVVLGPCSIHDHGQALAYADRLQAAAAPLSDALLVVMRTYFEKPRTTVGWKGYINDPHLDGSFAINEGLERARRLLLAIVERGLPVGTEFLDLLSPQFISDLVAWGAIGARTTESQSHRQLASGLSCPVGFKNGTDGGVKVAVDAIVAAAAPHAFMGMTKMGQAAIFETHGNADCHVILRGGKRPNYDTASVAAACDSLQAAGLRGHVMVDVSHGNSEKQHRRQIDITQDIAQRIAAGERRISGVMIESHLQEGQQQLRPGQPLREGVSITDACIGWDDTAALLQQLAGAVRQRRGG